jgi:hypothetical protein
LNPVVRALCDQLSVLHTKVMGTDESWIKIHGQIKGMCVMKGLPSLWITINPSDMGDPITQVFTGKNIDMDSFINTMSPNAEEQSKTITADPYVAAKFFHYVIAALLEELFGITAYGQGIPVKRNKGIFGKVALCIRTVKAQGRETLHLHMVIWLCGSLTSSKMKEALHSSLFRSKIKDYIKANIQADIDSADENAVKQMSCENCLSYSWPCDPHQFGHHEMAKVMECKLAKSMQHHQHSKDASLIVKQNHIQCKCSAPFEESDHDYIDEDGKWGPKRTYSYINNWCPPIMQCTCHNQDIKIITNGAETKDISFYISLYIAKRQAKSSNSSALLAKKLAFHRKWEQYNSDICRLNKRLLQQCANTLSCEQEFSVPEVISYLMGWGNHFISHHFVTIYWTVVTSLIRK